MNQEEALVRYAEQIKKTCLQCGAKPGNLCDTPGVWVHLIRFGLKQRPNKPVRNTTT